MVYITILRPVNCTVTFISVLIGAWIGKGIVFPPALVLAGLIGFTVCAYGNIINDLHDIDIDRINNPDRPLASGKATKRGAVLLAILFILLSILASISLGVSPFILVTGAAIVLYLYAYFIKKTILANIIISLIAGTGFLLGGMITRNNFCIYPYLFSFFIHMPREIIKDILDIEGDRQYGVVSLPIRFGVPAALTVDGLMIGLLCMMLPLPFLLRILTVRYMIVTLIGAYPILLYCIFVMMRKPSRTQLERVSMFYKISMVVGLFAMIV